MSLDHDEPDEGYEEDEGPRSIFSATWFRVILVALVLSVVGAIAVPYVIDVVNAPATTARASAPPAPEGAGVRAATTPPEPQKPVAPALAPSATAPTTVMPKDARPARGATSPEAPKPAAPARRAEIARSAPSAEAPKLAASAKPEAAKPANQSKPSRGQGDFFVQVGAFKDEGMARRVAARLREQNYPVAESTRATDAAAAEPPRPTPKVVSAGPSDRYDVLVSGGAGAEINTKLAAKGLASEPSGDGVRIRPSLPLREAVALSKDLGSEGFTVQVKRRGGSERAATASTVVSAPMLHRVRVGGYPDRAAAQTVLRELSDKGYEPFITKGRD